MNVGSFGCLFLKLSIIDVKDSLVGMLSESDVDSNVVFDDGLPIDVRNLGVLQIELPIFTPSTVMIENIKAAIEAMRCVFNIIIDESCWIYLQCEGVILVLIMINDFMI